MSKTLHRIRVAMFIAFLIEGVLLTLIAVFWILDLFSIQSIPYVPEYVFGAAVIFFVFDGLFFWTALRRVNKIRQKSDLTATRLLGSDLSEAYNFDNLGLLAVDEKNVVVWSNRLFQERGLDLVDTPVFEWLPQLEELATSPTNKTIRAEIKGRIYEIRYSMGPRLFLFKDLTDYVNVEKYSIDQATVLGIIMIDNYDAVASDTDDFAESYDRVRSLITDYCRDFGVLLRRIRNDTYFAVCNYVSLHKMEEDKFSLLDKVRASGENDRNRLTLSVGFAHNFPDIPQLNEMSTNAIDIALSRGGDQVVVSEYGADLRFFGGKTTALENTSKIKLRSFADSLITIIKRSTNVYVMGHTDMDMDALGSCLGIMAICEWCQIPCKIIYDSKRVERKTRIAFQSAFSRDAFEKMTILPNDADASIRAGTLLVVTDVSVPQMVMDPKIIDKASKIVVIDHHRRGDQFIERNVMAYVDPSASSASELITEMAHYATANPPIIIKPAFATLMLSGIFLDTNFFKNKSTGMMTFEAAEILKEFGADNSLADDYLKDEYEEYKLVNKIMSTMKTAQYGVVYCVADDKDIIDRTILAKVANQLMQLKNTNASFVIGRTDDKTIRMSARSDGSVNVQLLCEKMGGGGHFSMAASAWSSVPMEKILNLFLTTMDEYLDAARDATNTEGD